MTATIAKTKKLHVRERELQDLHSTPLGLMELKSIAAEYARASGKPFPEGESVITYILIYERDRGLIFV
jgi:hypothetical protein